MPTPLPLSVRSLGHRFPTGTEALSDVSFDVAPGEVVAVLGLSGAGKSTLLRCIHRLIRPTRGEVQLGQHEVSQAQGRALREHRARVGMIFQQFHLVPQLSVRRNVLIGMLARYPGVASLVGRFPQEAHDRAAALLERVGLLPQIDQRAGTLSGGQKQRVAIARALAQEPSLLLCDEPIASLDPRSAEQVMELLVSVREREGISLLLNLHFLDVARRWCERAVGLAGGAVVYDGPVAGLDEATLKRIYG